MACGGSALLTSVGGTAGQLFPDRGRMGYACIVHDHAELVAEIRRQVKVGVDWIKIHSTGLVPRQSGEILVWTDEELRLACDTAHALGVPVVAHARSAVSTAACARAGVDLILHASYLDDAALAVVRGVRRRSVSRRGRSWPTSSTTATRSERRPAWSTCSAARSRPPPSASARPTTPA